MIFRTAALVSLFAISASAQEGCSVCGEGLKVGFADAIFSFEGQPEISCGLLEEVGANGTIPLEQCVFLPALVEFTCECVLAVTPTDAPFAPALPPAAPVGTEAPATMAPIDTNTGTMAPVMTTGAPATVAPNTMAPNTMAPNTVTTVPPVTMAPAAPVTVAPVTMAPDTKAPDTKAPDTKAPDTKAPVTAAPSAPPSGSGATRMGMFATLAGVVAFFM